MTNKEFQNILAQYPDDYDIWVDWSFGWEAPSNKYQEDPYMYVNSDCGFIEIEPKEYRDIWIKCSERLPDTKSYKPTDTEYQVSEYVLTWDTFYGCEKNRLWDGKWETERKSKGTITPDVCHQIVAWMPIPKFMEE